MEHGLIDPEIHLPSDFVEFIQRNYERIEEIQQKVEQFKGAWQSSGNFKYLQKLSYHKIFESVDSCFSEGDTSKVIKAQIKPLLARLSQQSSEEYVSKYLPNYNNLVQSPFDPTAEYHSFVRKSHPLVYLDTRKKEGDDEDDDGKGRRLLIVEGIHVPISERVKPKSLFLSSVFPPNSAGDRKLFLGRHFSKKRWEKSENEKKRKHQNGSLVACKKCSPSERDNKVGFNNFNPQQPLPPLHSSVLALLGQRSGGNNKASPRIISTTTGAQDNSATATKQKKLRRHGRTRKKGQKDDDEKTENRAGSEEVRKVDDPHDTQISVIIDGNRDQGNEEFDECLEDLKENLQVLKETKRSLYNVVDNYLTGKPWATQDISSLDEQISEMMTNFQKLETKFQSDGIRLQENTWLGYPRTWSRSSATFGAPNDFKSLKVMKPIEYLQKFVTLSGPRKHLYTLVFQRHRTMENPTGKNITLKTLQPALSEILGRKFRAEEMRQLCDFYLGIQDLDFPIFEDLFLGISAFCERIFGQYSLEEIDNCLECEKNHNRDKDRCHKNQQSKLEKADLAFLFGKLKDGHVQQNLSHVILALCGRN